MSARESLKKFAYYINKGFIGWICPEGTRNYDSAKIPIKELKKGFTYVSDEVKCDIVVII